MDRLPLTIRTMEDERVSPSVREWLVILSRPTFEPIGEESEGHVAEHVDRQVADLHQGHIPKNPGNASIVSLNTSPAADRLRLLLGDVNDVGILPVPDGFEAFHVERLEAKAIVLDERCDLLPVRVRRAHF